MRRPKDLAVTSKYFIFQRKSFWWFFFFETPSCPSTWSSIWRNIKIMSTFLHQQRVFLPLPPSLSSTRPSFGAPCSQSLCSSTRPNFINDCGRRPWHKHNYSWCIDPHNQHLGSVPIVTARYYSRPQIFKQISIDLLDRQKIDVIEWDALMTNVGPMDLIFRPKKWMIGAMAQARVESWAHC